MNNHDRQEQQDRVFGALDVATAPIRLAKDMVQTVLIILLLIAIGVAYPIYLACTGQPVSTISLVVSGLTVLAVFTFIYAPYYFIFGGMALAAGFTWGVCAHEDFMYAHNFNGWGLAWLFFSFLALGVVQRFIRHRIFDLPKPPRDRRSPAERIFDYGDFGHAQLKGSLNEGQGHQCKDCEDAYRVLGVENGADNASLKDAYRDLAKVWHPDRFGDGDPRLQMKREEQFKAIQKASEHIQEHLFSECAATDEYSVGLPPLNEALKDAVNYFGGVLSSLFRRGPL
jgi:hypothetical protein